MPQARGQVRAGKREEFLVALEAIAVLFREHSADGNSFNRAKKETCQRQGQQIVYVGPAHTWQAGARNAARNYAQQFDAVA